MRSENRRSISLALDRSTGRSRNDVAILFDEPLGQLLLEENVVRAFSFDPIEEVIVRWIP